LFATDWEISAISTSRLLFQLGQPIMGTGEMPLEFFNRSSGAVEKFTAAFFAAAFISPPFSWIPGVPRSTQVCTKAMPFAIGDIGGKYGVVFAQEGTSGSVATLIFSRNSFLSPLFAWGAFAFVTVGLTHELFQKLSSGVLCFRVN
jgi:hypothetical protein